MREIKFRGQRVDNKKWVYGFVVKHSYLKKYFIYEMLDNTGALVSEVIPETVSQYTGLKDKNGVEIYEGDIVNFHIFTQELGVNYGVSEGEKEFKGYICFEELGLAFKQSEEDEEWFYLVYSPGMIHEESFEVIGNIHSNPELLK
ncbi:YopX family protein [Chryseobacterium sp. 2VB]|uniref:YopX family protein n=1 Tax=Chryseobacterium sp. 2VB TaxID=2502204 RepID=UPI0010F570B5|nr:YopX family protein [Chryseobacterium sp. 2VB]